MWRGKEHKDKNTAELESPPPGSEISGSATVEYI